MGFATQRIWVDAYCMKGRKLQTKGKSASKHCCLSVTTLRDWIFILLRNLWVWGEGSPRVGAGMGDKATLGDASYPVLLVCGLRSLGRALRMMQL